MLSRDELSALVRWLGEAAMAWRGASDATEAVAPVATYHDLLSELCAGGPDVDTLDQMNILPDVLMPPG